jgi:hypothetical protein
VHDDSFWISDPAEIAEVDRFGSDPEFLQHFVVQRWSHPHFDAALRGATQERERERERERVRERERERERRRMVGEESSSRNSLNSLVSNSSLKGPFI